MAVVGDGSEHQAARRAGRQFAQTMAAARTAAAHLPADDPATSQPGSEPASRAREISTAEPPPETEPRPASDAGSPAGRDVAPRSRQDTEVGPPEAEVASGRWSVGARLLLTAAAVVLVLGVMAVAVIVSDPYRLGQTYSDTGPQDTRQDTRQDAAAASDQTMTAPLAGRQKATFVLVDGLTSFDLRVTDLGDDLYRISSPSGTGVAARPVLDGETVRLGVVAAGASDGRAVRVLLNERVAWRLRLEGGVSEQVLDLTRARLRGVDLVGGSARTDLILPPVDRGVMTVRLTGGTSRLSVRVPGTPPVRVRAGAGAGSVVVRDQRWNGVAAGDLVSTPGWDRSPNRIFLDLVAGVNAVTVTEAR
ncbi:hypothetical protein [Micromonospora sp. NPDC049662]|uniref:hypothetical protein n=1 Tax=Micromonospora sp. NPDC049662 TaxID=3155397 RepID=UPI003428C789